MSHTPHELADEFPQDHDLLHKLKLEDTHFVTLSDRYHKLNREIHRIETQVEPASDDYVEMLKKQRLALIDRIGGIVATARSAA